MSSCNQGLPNLSLIRQPWYCETVEDFAVVELRQDVCVETCGILDLLIHGPQGVYRAITAMPLEKSQKKLELLSSTMQLTLKEIIL